MNAPVLWENLTHAEIGPALRAAGQAAMWPFGATEQHGPHLGTGVDTWIARAVCEEVSARTRVPVLPALPVGCSMGHSAKWPGTLSVTPATLIAFVTETGGWLHASGVRRLFLVNAHVTNHAPLRCALENLRHTFSGLSVALINTAEITPDVREEFFADADDWHANAAETSLVLHLRPEGAREELLASSDDPDRTRGLQFAHPVNRTSTNGVTGCPSRADADAGRRLFARMVCGLEARILAGIAEHPPLT